MNSRRVVGITTVVLGAPFVLLLVSYGTIRPCEMLKVEMRGAMMAMMAKEIALVC